jgi:cytochrome P450
LDATGLPSVKSKSIISLTIEEFIKQKGLENAEKVDEEFLHAASAQIRLFLFAGHDTTSSALIYCYEALANDAIISSRMRTEHDQVFGAHVPSAPRRIIENPELLNQLPYTTAVIKESLRLFPPASMLRNGKSGFEIIDDDGNALPTDGCYVWAIALLIQRNPKYFPDPHSFNPERWLVGPDHPLYPPKGAWRPFEFGPRSCLGQTLAMTELRTVLALTAREFVISPAYEEWDRMHGNRQIKTALGIRAYQVEGGGGGAHPSDRYPCIVSLR